MLTPCLQKKLTAERAEGAEILNHSREKCGFHPSRNPARAYATFDYDPVLIDK
jgi:hypothetical protein